MKPFGAASVEKKYFDTWIGETEVKSTLADCQLDMKKAGTDTATNCLNCPTQGNSVNQREGNKITMSSLEINAEVWVPSSATTGITGPMGVHLFVVLDSCNNSTDRSSTGDQIAAKVYGNPHTNAAGQKMSNLAFRVLEQSKRFKVLKSKRFVLVNRGVGIDGTNYVNGGDARMIKMHIPLKGLTTTFSGTDETAASIVNNCLWLCAVAETQATLPKIEAICRLRYYG